MSTRIRILLADDHPVVRDGLAAILGTQPDFEVVGMAATGLEAVRLAAEAAPDVVLLDLAMPEMDGFAFAAEVRMRPDNRALRAKLGIKARARVLEEFRLGDAIGNYLALYRELAGERAAA